MKKGIAILAIIPLILSMGIIPAIPFENFIQEAEALKSSGTPSKNYGYKTNNKVCGDRLCSEVQPKEGIAEYFEEEKAVTNLDEAGIKPCTREYMPVCGIDGKTYPNMCEMENGGTELAFEGTCEEAPIPVIPEEPVKIKLPPYPDQPSVNPVLEDQMNLVFPPRMHQVAENVWVAVGYGAANSIMIEGEDGIIIIDAMLTYETAKDVISEFRKITDKPVKAVIATHSHADHVGGTGAFLKEGKDVEIIFNERLVQAWSHEYGTLAHAAAVRGALALGSLLPEHGPDRGIGGIALRIETGTNAFVPPTKTFDKKLDTEIAGVKLKLRHVGGESTDQIFVWMPEQKIAFVGDNMYQTFPNLYTIRGAVCREPLDYVKALDEIIALNPIHVVPSHGPPIMGAENSKERVTLYRDATQYVYDQTIRGMNKGYNADYLANSITLPEVFQNEQFLREIRGEIPWHVRNIFACNLGWYQGDPAFLSPVSEVERAQRIVEGFGGTYETIKEVRKAIENDNVNWAAELATYVLLVDESNEEANLLKAQALRILGQRTTTSDGRNWFLSYANFLEGNLAFDPKLIPLGDENQMMATPIDQLFKILQTRIDPEKAEGVDRIMVIQFRDLPEDYTLHIRNQILAVSDTAHADPDYTLTLYSDTFKRIVVGFTTVADEVSAGNVEFSGDVGGIHEFLNSFESLAVN